MSTQLVVESSEVGDQMVNLMIESIYLCCIHDDSMEGVEVFVELLLKVCSSIHLFRDPDVSCRFKKHHGFLLFELTLSFLGVE